MVWMRENGKELLGFSHPFPKQINISTCADYYNPVYPVVCITDNKCLIRRL